MIEQQEEDRQEIRDYYRKELARLGRANVSDKYLDEVHASIMLIAEATTDYLTRQVEKQKYKNK